MYEDSSSGEEWGASTKRREDRTHPEAKCWECGKKFSRITSLMAHYKSHNIQATCHICKVTFRRLTSLSSHLDNVHMPALCKKCHLSFSSGWEFNKHAETQCTPFPNAPSLSLANHECQNSNDFPNGATAQQRAKSDAASEPRPSLRPRPQRTMMKPARAETSETSVELTVGEDDKDVDKKSDYEKADDSTSTESDESAGLLPDDPESDGGSSSTDCSSDSYHRPHSKSPPAAAPSVNSSTCAACGRGPFRALKLHLLHCSGVMIKYQCSLCKKFCQTEKSLREHYMPLYACETCSQVFPRENVHRQHQCPKGTRSNQVLFCAEMMPQVCNICKSFFTSEKTLLNHVTRVHTSVVSTKVCIIPNIPASSQKKVSPSGTAAISSPNVLNQVVNGKLGVSHTSHTDRTAPTIWVASPAAPITPGKDGAPGPTNQHLRCLSAALFPPPDATEKTPAAAASEPEPTPTIMAMFENSSHNVALMKRMNTDWRSKAPHPCRQCGAVLRQPSLVISHRYLHRGRRLHQCQCGRAFKRRLHLLRHCIQHAESVSYICVSCGETFTGAKLLAEHMKGKSRKKKSRSGRAWKRKAKRKCRMSFTCDCGQLFFRPSAYIWHQLKNRTKTKRLKKPLE